MKLILAIFMAATFAHSTETVRFVFKGKPTGLQGLTKMDFGLTETQKNELEKITSRKVNFKDLYYLDESLAKSSFLKTYKEYSTTIFKKVPPPMIIHETDPDFEDAWWQKQLDVEKAWGLATGDGVTIADCDAGYYVSESDLNENLLMNEAYDLADIDNPTKVDDGNFVNHGTSVVAIMSGVLNGSGTNGIAFNSKVIPLQNYNYNSTLDDLGKEEATAKCILHALKIPEVKIIVLENQTRNGSSETFAGTREAVRLALEAGVVIVSAGGNYYKELLEEEKDNTGSIIIGAVNKNGVKETWSNYGSRVTIAAYGSDLKTLSGPNGKMGSFGGTSGATPQVAGTIALMLEVAPHLTPSQVKEILIQTRTTNTSNEMVGGVLNTNRAVQLSMQQKLNSRYSDSFVKGMFRQRIIDILK